MGHVRSRPEPTAMRFDDPAADRQAHAHALRLGRVERLEDPVETLRVEARPRIADRDHDLCPGIRLELIHSSRGPSLTASWLRWRS